MRKTKKKIIGKISGNKRYIHTYTYICASMDGLFDAYLIYEIWNRIIV